MEAVLDLEQEQQAALVAFLGDRRNWGSAAPVEQVQTHAARIFLVGERAYKLKRAVRYSFLDFSTLERRRRALEAELRLNRRTAPMLYRRVLPVTRGEHGGFQIDGAGEPVDWLLEMMRFDRAAGLDRIAAAGALNGRLVDDLAEAIVELHAQAEIERATDGHRRIAEVIDGNAADLGGLAGEHLPAEAVRRLNEATATELARQRPLLEARARAGRIRHGHGDLHLANILVLDGRPVLFDCLEFDPELARTDVLYDLAFLIMDLLHQEQRAAAQRLLSVYLERTEDDAGVALLPLFLAVRATIRAKIAGFEGRDRAHRGIARAYLDQALRFLEHRPQPLLIAIGGLSGTGKSTLARALAPDLGPAPGAVVVRSDGIRKRLFGRRPHERLGPEAYREEVSGEVFEHLAERAESLLQAAHAVIGDGVFLRPEQRARVARSAEAAGVPFRGLWLEARGELIGRRVGERSGDASDATAEVVRAQLAVDPGPIGWTTLAAGGPPEEVAAEARRIIGSAGSISRE